jgi:transcriptional regulator with XRE-family HTH domain
MPRSRRSPRQFRLQEILAAKRIDDGVTQTELAAKLRRPQSFVSKYESGERRLDVVELIEVCQALGLTAKDVVADLCKVKSD